MWILLPLTVVLLLPRDAEAYIDPGSASYIFQVVVGAALGAFFLVRTYWAQLKTAVRSRFAPQDRADG